MKPGEILTKLNAMQRVDMIEQGLSPMNPAHVQRYLKGQTLTENEAKQRAQQLFGDIKSDLGGGREKEMTVDVGMKFDPNSFETNTAKPRDFRQQMNEDMMDMPNGGRTIGLNDIVAGRQPIQPQRQQLHQPQQQQAGGVYNEGYENAKKYLNALGINLQQSNLNESYKHRLSVYKALEHSLKAEQKYANDKAKLREYRSGVLAAEQAMLQLIRNSQ
jgi:hypothetical protein